MFDFISSWSVLTLAGAMRVVSVRFYGLSVALTLVGLLETLLLDRLALPLLSRLAAPPPHNLRIAAAALARLLLYQPTARHSTAQRNGMPAERITSYHEPVSVIPTVPIYWHM